LRPREQAHRLLNSTLSFDTGARSEAVTVYRVNPLAFAADRPIAEGEAP
jgi:hypothetical protein